MEKKLRRKILEKWSRILDIEPIWGVCKECGKVHDYDDVTEKDLDKLLNICVEEHEKMLFPFYPSTSLSLSDKIETNPFLGASCRVRDVKEAVKRLKEWIIEPDTEPKGDIDCKCLIDKIDKIFGEKFT